MAEPGPVGEEAAKLVEAMAAWARGALGGVPATEHEHAHAAAGGSEECRLCPFCQLVRAARSVRPETIEHLLDASASLAAALRSALEHGDRRPASGIHHIDIE